MERGSENRTGWVPPRLCDKCGTETMSVTRRDHGTGEWIEIVRCFGCGGSKIRHTGRWGPMA